MKKSFIVFLSIFLSLCLFLTSCAQSGGTPENMNTHPEQTGSPGDEDDTLQNGREESGTDEAGWAPSVQGLVFLYTEEDVDLTGVKLEISKKTNVVVFGGLTTYGAEYIGSVYSDADGKIVYEKPHDPFVLEIDLSTLPSGMGLKKRFYSYHDTSEDEGLTVELQKVVSAEAYFVYRDLNFIFKNADNENVQAYYEVLSHHVVNGGSSGATAEALAEQYSGDIAFTLTHAGNVSVNGVLFSYSVDQAYSEVNYADYVALLYGNNCITEDEKTLMLEKFYATEYGKAYLSEQGCCLPG